MAGHWVLLDDLQNVASQIPELERFLGQVFSWKGEKQLREKKEKRRIEELQEDVNEDMRRELDDIELAALVKAVDNDEEEGSRRLVLPALKDFEVTQSFRLWIAVGSHSPVPVSLLQGSQKFIFEPIKGVQMSCTKLLNATIMELFTGCSELRDDYRHMYFALTFLPFCFSITTTSGPATTDSALTRMTS